MHLEFVKFLSLCLNSTALVTSSNGTCKSLSSEDDSFDKCEFCIFIETSA